MKRHQVVLSIAMLNVGILAIAAFTIRAAAHTPQLPQPDYQAARVNWSRGPEPSEISLWGQATLSPTKRPQIEKPIEPETPPRELTDAELRAELEAKIAREIRLLRIVYADGDPKASFAKVRLGSREIVLAPNSGFYETVPDSIAKTLPAWLKDVQVGEISPQGVRLNAASARPDKRFDLTLTLKEPGTITVGPLRLEEAEARKSPPSVRELRDRSR